MLVLLPPAETKRAGGTGPALRLDRLAWPEALGAARRQALDALVALANDEEASRRALHLGPRGAGEVRKNRDLLTAATMPALQRYDGVLYRAAG
ncbi:MAG TPA: peroxide stress protein YaaA, partial [Microbacteriaceae bacterium]|nr:peroxide stress protein YaaA [Microbacteriaceae bacterium]